MSRKPGPLKRCATEGCTVYSALAHCAKHRRPAEVRMISKGELARRARENLELRDALSRAHGPGCVCVYCEMR